MKIHLKYQNNSVANFTELINKYNPSEIDSPRRSTVHLLVFWKDTQKRIEQLFFDLNLNKPNNVTACFEYRTPIQKGSGKPSYTDLMLIADDQVMAVEAKYTEPEYEKVKEWLGNPSSPNRQDVLSGWVELIQKTIGMDINEHFIMDMPYQMIHRTASACYPKASNRAVVYQYFGNDRNMEGYYKNELTKMSKVLGEPDILKLCLLIRPLIKKDKYIELEQRWNKNERKLSMEVKEGILNDDFLDFGTTNLLTI